MSLTLLQLRTAVRDNIEEASAGYWSDAELTRKINSAYERLWMKIMQLRKNFFHATDEKTFTVGTNTVTLIDNFYRAKRFRIISAGEDSIIFRYKDSSSPEFIELQRSDVTVALPSEFLFDILGQNTLIVAPIPRVALTFKYDYYKIVTRLSADGDTFEIIDPFISWVEHEATSMLLAKGPVGAYKHWQDRAASEWIDLLLTLDTIKQDMTPDTVESMFDGT